MLRSLHVENYVLIDSLEVQFPQGLIIITGQTGAGKSILLGALSLLTGAKADASVISGGADSLIVEAVFDSSPELEDILEKEDIPCPDREIIIRRVVFASGRSRSFINDCPVSVGLLGELSSLLIDIHSQHQNLLLARSDFQLGLLDSFARCEDIAASCRRAWAEYRSLEKELEQAKAQLQDLQAKRDYNQAQYEQLSAAKIKVGEIEELELEQKSLANAEQIKEQYAIAGGLLDLHQQLRDAQRALEKAGRFVPAMQELESRVESARIEIDDILGEVENADASLDVSKERLDALEERLGLLYSLERKHNVHSEEELLEILQQYADALARGDNLEFSIDELEKRCLQAKDTYGKLAEELHKARAAAAPELARTLEARIRNLELDKARFEVEISKGESSENGYDKVCYKFSSNSGACVELAKCASGGEMSRIMLCIKELMARYRNMPTMIFDEIDTGVSGSVAHKMGKMICDMGACMQVFAITHLPQVAARGQAHFLVSKFERNGRTVSSISRLDSEARVQEIARMLSGESITAESLANAKSLLEQ